VLGRVGNVFVNLPKLDGPSDPPTPPSKLIPPAPIPVFGLGDPGPLISPEFCLDGTPEETNEVAEAPTFIGGGGKLDGLLSLSLFLPNVENIAPRNFFVPDCCGELCSLPYKLLVEDDTEVDSRAGVVVASPGLGCIPNNRARSPSR